MPCGSRGQAGMMSDDPRTAPSSGAQARRLASARRAAANAEAIRLRFIDDVDMARLAPGSCFALDKIARSYGCAKEALLPVLDELQTRGLIKRSGVDWHVAPIEGASLCAQMDTRLVIEQDLAEAAARNVSALNRQELAELVGDLQRAAVVGDIDGYMMSDRRLEKAIAAAADAVFAGAMPPSYPGNIPQGAQPVADPMPSIDDLPF